MQAVRLEVTLPRDKVLRLIHFWHGMHGPCGARAAAARRGYSIISPRGSSGHQGLASFVTARRSPSIGVAVILYKNIFYDPRWATLSRPIR